MVGQPFHCFSALGEEDILRPHQLTQPSKLINGHHFTVIYIIMMLDYLLSSFLGCKAPSMCYLTLRIQCCSLDIAIGLKDKKKYKRK